MKKYFPPLVAGFAAGVFLIVPVIKNLSCCVIIPFASYLALFLEMKSQSVIFEIKVSRGALIGLLTGLTAAFFATSFDVLITFITKSNDIILAFNNLPLVMENFPFDDSIKQQIVDIFETIVNDIKTFGFSPVYAASMLVNNLFFGIVFGTIGGMISVPILNSRLRKEK